MTAPRTEEDWQALFLEASKLSENRSLVITIATPPHLGDGHHVKISADALDFRMSVSDLSPDVVPDLEQFLRHVIAGLKDR